MSSVELLGLREYEGSIGPDPITLSPTAGGGGAWTPASLSSLSAWYDASNTSSITQSSGAVSQWNDLSGNGFNLVQATGVNQPTTGLDTINSKNVIKWNSSQWMDNTSITLSSPVTIYFVGLCSNTGTFRVPYDSITAATACTTYINQVTPTYHIANPTDVDTTQLSSTVAFQMVTIFNGASSEFFYAKSQVGTTFSIGTGGLGKFRIGANRNTTAGWVGDIGETVIQNAAASGTDLSNWNTYCSRWGL